MTSLGIEHDTTGLNHWLRQEFDIHAAELGERLGSEGDPIRTALDGMRRAFEAAMDAEAASNREYRHTLTHDRLTGLLNIQEMQAIVEHRLEEGKPTGVLVVDLDRFKPLNDKLGHEVGDELLQKLSDYLRQVVWKVVYRRKDDAVGVEIARWGGDEFVIAIDLSGGEQRTRPGETIHDRMERQVEYLEFALGAFFGDLPPELGDIELGATIGYAVWDPDDSSRQLTANELLKEADYAMNRAKPPNSR